ncbi:MAG: ABC transporter permease [Chitinophagaceae bacterium]
MKLLSIEWLKIRRYRTFWILSALFLVFLPLWNYEIANGVVQMGGGGINILSQAYTFPEVWSNLGWWGSIFILFLAILIITLTCNEFTFKTNRQNVIDGWSRMDFFQSKVLLVLTFSLITTLFVFLLGVIFGLSKSGSATGMFNHLEALGYFFILSLNYLGAALFMALWIRKSGLTISLYLLYAMIIEYAAASIINHSTGTKIGNLLPLQASDELLPFPLMKMAQSMIGKTEGFSDYTYVIASLVWIAIYYFAARSMMLKRDL